MCSFERKMSDYLSALPMELIHRILDYIPTVEFLQSFSFVSKHLRSISIAHSRLRPNLTIRLDKRQFDSLCTQLFRCTSQIVSLTLFDHDDPLTPIKNALFFTRFHQINEKLSNLRSLALTYITYDTWCSFKDRISSSLTTLSIHLVHVGPRADASMTSAVLNEILLFSLLFEHLSIKMSNYSDRLTFISLKSGISLPFLRYFRSEGISIDTSGLSLLAPLLQTLEFHHRNESIKLNYILLPSLHLQRLRLELRSLSWTEIEAIFTSFSRLKHLIIIVDDARINLADGFLWAAVLRDVKDFQMRLSFGVDVFSRRSLDLHSFRTKFWLEEKKWIVTYQQNLNNSRSVLYTNPSPINDDSSSTIVGIIPSESTLFPGVHCVTINYPYLKQALIHDYIHTTNVDLFNGTGRFTSTFKDLVDYLDTLMITTHHVRSEWIRKSPDDLIGYLCGISYVHALSVPVTILKYLYSNQWAYITDLRIENDPIHGYQLTSSDEIEALCYAFPCIERLDIHSTSTTILPHLLQRMKETLIDVVIRQPLSANQNQQLITRQWIEQNVELTHIHYVRDNMNSVTLWL